MSLSSTEANQLVMAKHRLLFRNGDSVQSVADDILGLHATSWVTPYLSLCIALGDQSMPKTSNPLFCRYRECLPGPQPMSRDPALNVSESLPLCRRPLGIVSEVFGGGGAFDAAIVSLNYLVDRLALEAIIHYVSMGI